VALGSEQEQAKREQQAAQNHPGFPAKGVTAEEAQQTAQSNVALFAQRQAPRMAGDTFDMLATAKEQGYDFAPVMHPSGSGFLIVPRDRVTPDMVAGAEKLLNETIARMRAADAQPVQRAERRSANPIDLEFNTDPVASYVDQMRTVQTPAARAYVGEFDAGRITRQDVEARMLAERAAQAERDRLAREAAVLKEEGKHGEAALKETVAAMGAPAAVQAVEVPKVSGVSTRTTVDFEVADLLALVQHIGSHPELLQLLQVDSVKLRAYVKSLGMSTKLPGVRVFEKQTLASGR
jgi:hypothetical protein